jgi:hypothetical protein
VRLRDGHIESDQRNDRRYEGRGVVDAPNPPDGVTTRPTNL